MFLKKLNKCTCYNTRTTLAWGYHHRSLLLPEERQDLDRNPKNYSFILNATLTVLLREKVSWPLTFPFNYACIMINFEPRGFLKSRLNSHANNTFLKNVLKWLVRTCVHFCKINSVNTQLINCCIKVPDTRYGANDFRDLDLFQHLCLHISNIPFFMKSSTFFSAILPKASVRIILEENIKVFFFHYLFQIIYRSWRLSCDCLWEFISQLNF